MQTQAGMKHNTIKKVYYIGSKEELYIQFDQAVYPSYDTVCFVNVPIGTARRFKSAENDKDNFFQNEIRTKFRHYATHIEYAMVQLPEFYKTNPLDAQNSLPADVQKIIQV